MVKGRDAGPVPVGVEPSPSRISTTPLTVAEFVLTTATFTRFPGSGRRPSMYIANSSMPYEPPIIGIDWSDMLARHPHEGEAEGAAPGVVVDADRGRDRVCRDDPDVPGRLRHAEGRGDDVREVGHGLRQRD